MAVLFAVNCTFLSVQPWHLFFSLTLIDPTFDCVVCSKLYIPLSAAMAPVLFLNPKRSNLWLCDIKKKIKIKIIYFFAPYGITISYTINVLLNKTSVYFTIICWSFNKIVRSPQDCDCFLLGNVRFSSLHVCSGGRGFAFS